MVIDPARWFIALPEDMKGLAGALRPACLAQDFPEPLVATTVKAALRISRDKAAPASVLSKPVALLVREALQDLATNQWTLATVLIVGRNLLAWHMIG